MIKTARGGARSGDHTQNAFFAGQGTETVYVNKVFRGILFEDGEELRATSIDFGLTQLVDWVLETGISETLRWREDAEPLEGDEPNVQLEGRLLGDRRIAVGRRFALSLRHSVGVTGDRMNKRGITQDFRWRIDARQLTPVEDLLDMASDLQDLVSIATDSAQAFVSLDFRHPDIPIQRIIQNDLPRSSSSYGGAWIRRSPESEFTRMSWRSSSATWVV